MPVLTVIHVASINLVNFLTVALCLLVADGLGAVSGWSRTTCSGTGGTGVELTNGSVANSAPEACAAGGLHAPLPARRQKSYDELDPTAMACARTQKGNQLGQIQVWKMFLKFCLKVLYRVTCIIVDNFQTQMKTLYHSIGMINEIM